MAGENAVDLCLAATVADDLGVASSDRIKKIVTAASYALARHCGRQFEKGAAIVEYPASYDRPYLLLARTPVLSITSIEIAGSALEATQYECIGPNLEAGMVLRRFGNWPRTARDNGRITPNWHAYQGEGSDYGVEVTYTAGYVTPGQNALDAATYPTVTVPEDLQEAAVQTAVALYRSRGVDQWVQSESIGDWAVSYFADKAKATSVIPATAQALAAPYVRQLVL